MLALNRIVKSVAPKWLYNDIKNLVSSAVTFNQGDLLYLDTTNHLVKAVPTSGATAALDGSTVLGIATCSVAAGVVKGPYAGLSDNDAVSGLNSAIQGPVYGVEVKLVLKTGDALTSGSKVYLDAANGTHHCTATAGSSANEIGYYAGPAIASASAGQEIVVLLAGTPYMK